MLKKETTRTWLVTIPADYQVNRGFATTILVVGTEREMVEYITSEIGYSPAYRGVDEETLQAAEILGIKTYYAPEIK